MGVGVDPTMKKKETLEEKAYRLWKAADLPEFLNRKGPKKTPGWRIYLAQLEYTNHAPAWRRAADFMDEYHHSRRHWTTWQKAIAKWPQEVWDALQHASAGDAPCAIAAIDGTTLARSNPVSTTFAGLARMKRSAGPYRRW
ncbi:MAG: hypothetical protein Q7S65_04860 [Nanoarchaeota archaeon]|nr:hypothetical protein [Nanoarchaeota archaeon]